MPIMIPEPGRFTLITGLMSDASDMKGCPL
jgi:hypothetical protein